MEHQRPIGGERGDTRPDRDVQAASNTDSSPNRLEVGTGTDPEQVIDELAEPRPWRSTRTTSIRHQRLIDGGTGYSGALMGEPIGVIAGGGGLPMVIAEGMRATGREVCVIGLGPLPGRSSTWPIGPPPRGPCGSAAGSGRVAASKKRCRTGRGRRASVPVHAHLPDLRTIDIWYRRLPDKRSAHLLRVVDELSSKGITLIDSTTYIPDHMATSGVMTDKPISGPSSRTFDSAGRSAADRRAGHRTGDHRPGA